MSQAKEAAGRRAAEYVADGMILGLGTGSTIHFTLVRLAERIRAEKLAVRGVPTSLATHQEALELGIPVAGLDEVTSIDLTIDGADEIDGAFRMIKGGGGALLREKVVAALSEREVIVVDPSKVVERLGTTFALPVEVVPFALAPVTRRIATFGCRVETRQRDGAPFHTDNGNLILDCRFPEGIRDPETLDHELLALPGVVETGLFLGLAHVLVIGRADGTSEVREKA